MAADNFLWFPAPATGGLLVGKATQPEGETTDHWFHDKKALEVLSFGFGVSQAETSGSGSTGAGAGKAKFEEFSPDLAPHCPKIAHHYTFYPFLHHAHKSPLDY